jgi:hypothetical protein
MRDSWELVCHWAIGRQCRVHSPLPIVIVSSCRQLNQHCYENFNTMSSRCVLCDRSFDSDESLHQHKRESPAHTFDCRTCDRYFSTGTALQQHLRDSPVHAPSFTVRPAIDPSATSRRCSSTYATPRFMLRPSTARTAIDLSIAKRRCSSTCGIHQRMRRPSTVRLATDPSATRRLWSSTYGTLAFTSRIRKPLWMSFSALSQRLIMTLLSHQLHRMPTCRDKKDGAVAVPRPTMRGTDIKTHCKANCICGTVQRTI